MLLLSKSAVKVAIVQQLVAHVTATMAVVAVAELRGFISQETLPILFSWLPVAAVAAAGIQARAQVDQVVLLLILQLILEMAQNVLIAMQLTALQSPPLILQQVLVLVESADFGMIQNAAANVTANMHAAAAAADMLLAPKEAEMAAAAVVARM